MHRLRTGFGLFAFYAIVTLIPIAILGALLQQSIRTDLDHRGLDQGMAVANSVARASIDPILSGDTLADGVTAAERSALLKVAMSLADSGDALQLRIRDRLGHVVFDPRAPDRGPTGGPDEEVQKAIGDAPVRLLTRLNADEIDTAKQLGQQAIEIYTPIRSTQSGPALGALEIYVPYSPIAASIDQNARHLTTLLIGGLAGLWMLLAIISWSVTRRLRRAASVQQRLAREDSLTGLANRSALLEQLNERLVASTPSHPVTVAVLDLDGFAHVNKVLGPVNGDRFLRHAADRLRETAATDDVVARLGGDQFAMVFVDTNGRQADALIARIRRALLAEVELGGIELASEVTIGLVQGADGDDPGELLRQAGVACRSAKRDNAPVLSYDVTLEGFDADRLRLVTELRHSINSAALALHYQPKIATVSGQVIGVEALLRWHHPTRGLLLPGAFLPSAESTELILPMTDWVVDEACRQAAIWQDAGLDLPIAVNISARCLRDPTFADRVLTTLMRHHVKADRLAIEVTETAVISNPDRAAATLRRLAQRGMTVSIDDFGVGYTSLGLLDRLPISEIKIDQQFVRPLSMGIRAGAIARGIILLGHELGLTVVAEGVEDDETLASLTELGCDLAQGYLIARPAPVDDFERWLTERPGLALRS
ncbi:MAG: bifunctional diguanylate cyclase/phosphodiesterase [Acidimicrobiia bacterium]